MIMSKYTLADFGKVSNVEFAKEAFRAVIANKDPAIDEQNGSCRYRTATAACAIGVCLTEKDVTTIGCLFGVPIEKVEEPIRGVLAEWDTYTFSDDQIHFLNSMQSIHDDTASRNQEMTLSALIETRQIWPYKVNNEVSQALDELQKEADTNVV